MALGRVWWKFLRDVLGCSEDTRERDVVDYGTLNFGGGRRGMEIVQC